jgi:uncharacterized membrane protein
LVASLCPIIAHVLGGLTIATATGNRKDPLPVIGLENEPMIEPILIVGIVIAATAWYVQHKWRKRLRALRAQRDIVRDTSGLELLARRYARGEIDRDEYLEKRDDILAAPAMPRSRA